MGTMLDPMGAVECNCALVNNSDPEMIAANSSLGPLTAVTTRMCNWITEDGGFSNSACSAHYRVAYATKRANGNPRVHFDITSGEASDFFCASNSTASLSFTSGAGMDEVCVSSMNPNATG